MSCKICGRSSCASFMHSIEQQEAYEQRQSMSDDVETLRIQLQEAQSEISSLTLQVIGLKAYENHVERYADEGIVNSARFESAEAIRMATQ